MIPLWKKILSWIYPLNIEKRHSDISGILEVNLQYGNLVLDSPTANYSFGNLHIVFQEAINKLHLSKNKKYNVLILGFGAGSIANILLNEEHLNCSITGIELDKSVLFLTKKYFFSNTLNQVNLIEEDAYEFVLKNTNKYDLVFIDLFINSEIPKAFQSKLFLNNIKDSLNKNAYVLMNTMNKHPELLLNWKEVFMDLAFYQLQENNVLNFQLNKN